MAHVFIDTNILLRAQHTDMKLHAEAQQKLLDVKKRGDTLWISRQVIREYLVQVTRPGLLAEPLNAAEVDRQIDRFRLLFEIADETALVTQKLQMLLGEIPTIGKQIHDANIVATMLVYQIPTLITLNTADFQRFSARIQLETLPTDAA